MEQDNALTVLIVEDEPYMAKMLKMLLERKFSATVEIAKDCASAREKLESQAFDIITLDYQLPDGDGLELFQETQAMDTPPPVIMVTGHGDEQTAVESFKLGASGYVVKDKRLQIMITDAVEHALSEIRLKRAEEALREEKAFTEDALNSLKDAFYVLGMDGRFLRWNKAVTQVTGYSDGEMSSMTVQDFYETSSEQRQQAFLETLIKEGHASIEENVTTKDGRLIPYYFSATLLKDHEGNPTAVCAIGRDITERKRAEEALGESLKRFQDIAENTMEWIWEVDSKGEYTYASPVVERVLGYRPEEVIGKHFYDFFHPEDREELKEAAFEVFERKEPFVELINRNSDKDGQDVWLSTSGVPILGESGELLGYRGVDVDITESKRAEEELERINIELEGYAHAASHDLRGPLSAIMLGVDMLSKSLEGIDTWGVEKTSEIVAIISRNVGNMQRRTEDLLALAESGQVPGETSPVDVREIIEGVLQERSHEIKEKGIEVDTSPDLGTITGDPMQIRQVFSNLVGNAIRYNDRENPIIQVSYLGDDEDGAHRYLVRDNGPGTPQDIIDDVFLPFIKGKSGDTGIGLSIAEKLVKVYGGEIRAYNDNGAVFEFTLKDYEVE